MEKFCGKRKSILLSLVVLILLVFNGCSNKQSQYYFSVESNGFIHNTMDAQSTLEQKIILEDNEDYVLLKVEVYDNCLYYIYQQVYYSSEKDTIENIYAIDAITLDVYDTVGAVERSEWKKIT